MVQDIGNLLRQHDWQVEILTGDLAIKELVVSKISHRRVLHLATHGFFRPDPNAATAPVFGVRMEGAMFGSGLVLAGANTDLAGSAGTTTANASTLTSYEIGSLDLSGTELVVLSACETGVGDTLIGGEIFGLRRAFQLAGSEAVLMSLWDVPADQTKDLMAAFYREWIGGADKYTALRNAQLAIRRSYEAPHYWGAFILVGGS
jgi:CHAT domain-containing protein